MNPHTARHSRAVEPEPLEAWGFTRKPSAQPAPQDLEQRFKEVTDTIDKKLDKFQQSLEFMVRLLDERLASFEARLPPAVKARMHDTPLFARPP